MNGKHAAARRRRRAKLRVPPFTSSNANLMPMWNPWFAVSSQAALLGLEVQDVIGLRLMRLAAGGTPAAPRRSA
jgi:hypothetical protein